ncbi:Dynamin family protein [Pseudomonas sp. NFACC23-1]|uniref:dynamin family protein n=1 Tax=unclassified Pseudomonas TaxID=196821 RepID=UPI000881853D|nr:MULTISPECIES: dynamin family protein [unclassified Pseudomonas]SDB09059.1 Dynamin family protein [Pseudomonas sp. NFACC17-2]SEJ03438.1 Dynamin family protein [Pseudomonas sp. NFACC23-1]SFW38644.1 Dynamin family protein [Pseudomonas sp. NFACC16-2]
MNAQHVLDLNQRLHQWMEKYNPELEKDIAQWLRKHAIDRTEDLNKAFSKLAEENRLLQIGVVGRVKAGKSSLLNALIFDGHAILPRAATPMTAALTTLTHGDTFGAEVQFYSAADRENIEQNALRYEQRLREEKSRAYETLSQRRQRSGRHVEDEQFHADVEKTARRALQGEHALAAAHDQWQSIRSSSVDFKSLDSPGRLQATDAQALADKLLEYVGVGGNYMPLTKSVDIFLPLDSLRNVRIIDTPGLNDPVQSREERTTALLKNCDVVFIVSPAGQFLSEQDIEMMSRITQKEGVQELVLIASQVDNQLYGSDTRQPTLQGSLDKITQTLSAHMVDTLQRLKVQHPEIGATFDNLIDNGAGKVLHTSGMCHSLSVRFDQQGEWDSGEQKAWENLQANYPDFFTPEHTERCRGNLDLLANTEALRAVLDSVRAQKDRIIEDRRAELIRAKSSAMEAFRADLLNFTQAKYQEVRNADIEDLKTQRRKLSSLMTVGAYELDGVLNKCVEEFREQLEAVLFKKLEKAYGLTQTAVDASVEEKEDKREVVRDSLAAKTANWLWGGGLETRSYTVFKLFWGKVYTALEDFVEGLADTLRASSKSLTDEFREKLVRESTKAARQHLGEDMDPALIIHTSQGLVSNFTIPAFELNSQELRKLKRSGTCLRDDEARDFLDEANHLLDKLKRQAKQQIRFFKKDVTENLPPSYGKAFFQDMQDRIEQLEEQVGNALLTLDRLQRMAKELEAA